MTVERAATVGIASVAYEISIHAIGPAHAFRDWLCAVFRESTIRGNTMRAAISIDDDLLHDADETARRMGLSRSGLFALAVAAFLGERREQMLKRTQSCLLR